MTAAPSLPGFDPSDPVQQSFLSALALGESGPNGTVDTGFGNVDLSSAGTDAYGFPVWGGGSTPAGPTHAAGLFQFQPGTWDQIASALNLNFSNPADQENAAWTYAAQTYAANTGGNLETDLTTAQSDQASGNVSGAQAIYNQIQAALGGVFSGVNPNQNLPQGLSGALLSGQGAALPGITTNSAAGTSSSGGSGSSAPTNWAAFINDFFVRFGLVIVGGLVVLVALWQLVSSRTDIPSPGETVKAAGKGLAAVVE